MNRSVKGSFFGMPAGLFLVWTIGQVYAAQVEQAALIPEERTFKSFSLGDYYVDIYALGGGVIERSLFEKHTQEDMDFILTFPNDDRVELTVFHWRPEVAGSVEYIFRVVAAGAVDAFYFENGRIDCDGDEKATHHERPTCKFSRYAYFDGIPHFAQPPPFTRAVYDERRNNLQLEANQHDVKFRVIIRTQPEELSHAFGFKNGKPY